MNVITVASTENEAKRYVSLHVNGNKFVVVLSDWQCDRKAAREFDSREDAEEAYITIVSALLSGNYSWKNCSYTILHYREDTENEQRK